MGSFISIPIKVLRYHPITHQVILKPKSHYLKKISTLFFKTNLLRINSLNQLRLIHKRDFLFVHVGALRTYIHLDEVLLFNPSLVSKVINIDLTSSEQLICYAFYSGRIEASTWVIPYVGRIKLERAIPFKILIKKLDCLFFQDSFFEFSDNLQVDKVRKIVITDCLEPVSFIKNIALSSTESCSITFSLVEEELLKRMYCLRKLKLKSVSTEVIVYQKTLESLNLSDLTDIPLIKTTSLRKLKIKNIGNTEKLLDLVKAQNRLRKLVLKLSSLSNQIEEIYAYRGVLDCLKKGCRVEKKEIIEE